MFYRHEDGFNPTAKFLENHQGHSLGFEGQDFPSFFDGYRSLDVDDKSQPLEPLDSEELEWVKNDPRLRHPLDINP